MKNLAKICVLSIFAQFATGAPGIQWASAGEELVDCDATLKFYPTLGGTFFTVCLNHFNDAHFCNFIGHVDGRPVHVPFAMTGTCPNEYDEALVIILNSK